MALVIRKREVVKYRESENKGPLVRYELDCDTTSDLPTEDIIEGEEMAQGSIAWIVKDGVFYGYSSDGEWNKQGDS